MACLALWALPAFAIDLSKIDLRIAKEPANQTNTPKYCLLVFGPEAQHRVWLVLDGDTLYVDKNGDADLTAPDERVALPRLTKVELPYCEAIRKHEINDLTVAGGRYRLMLQQMAIRKPIDGAGAGPQLFHMYRSYQGQMVFVLDVRVAKEPNWKQPPTLPKEAKHFLAAEDQEGCSHSLMFRLHHSLGPQVAPTARLLRVLGGRATYTTPNSGRYRHRALASLRA